MTFDLAFDLLIFGSACALGEQVDSVCADETGEQGMAQSSRNY